MIRRYNVSFLVPILKGGGAERNVINLISNIDKDTYNISVVTGNIGGNLEDSIPRDVGIVNLKSSNFFTLFIKLLRYLRKEKPDILFSALPHINTITMMAKTFSGSKTKIILTEHTTFSLIPSTTRTFTKKFIAKFILPRFMSFFYPLADAIVCVSNGVAEDLYKIVGHLSTIRVIYNPVTDEKIYNLSKESLGEDQSLFSKEYFTIIAVGRLVKAKDYQNLLKAFNLVLSKSKANLIILGEGPEEKSLKDLAQKLGIMSHIRFLGFKNNPYKYLANSSVFILSSIREGFGNVIVEAMACGVPVIATDCKSGPNEIIQNGMNGILVPPQDPETLSEAILQVLNNSTLARTLSFEGKKRAEYFSIYKSVKEYETVFQQLIKN